LGVILLPAIDLVAGRAVRLEQGDRKRCTVYDVPPAALVERFARAGAKTIHVVDLDGAFAGEPAQTVAIAALVAIAHEHGATVEVGGGMRSRDAVERTLDAGADAAVVGTLALREPDTVAELCARHPGRIVVAADAKDGRVAVDGWREHADTTAATLARTAERWGAAAVLHTDVARDGLQEGPAVQATAAIQAAVAIPVYASGGVGTLRHVEACKAAGIRGVVVGRALYEGAFTIEEALLAADAAPETRC
jgi:phosphoribosylformimino-5-aminoimidazole carboxamide ribotide isomerase